MEWLNAFTAAACALSAILAWIAKIYWSKEFAAAKDEIVKAKDTQIALLEREIIGLKELSPMKIREYFNSMRDQLSEYIETLKNDLEKAHTEIQNRDTKIADLKKMGGIKEEIIIRLEEERARLAGSVHSLEHILEKTISQPAIKIKKVDTFSNNISLIEKNYNNLRNFLGHTSSSKNTNITEIASTIAAWNDTSISFGNIESGFNEFKKIFGDKNED